MKIKLLLSKWTSKVEEGALNLRTRLTTKLNEPSPRRLRLKQLEERVMMSAAPVPVEVPDAGDAADGGVVPDEAITQAATAVSASAPSEKDQPSDGDQHLDDGEFVMVWSEDRGLADSQADTKSNEIVFVDTAAENYEDLVADIINNADESRNFDVYVLDSTMDGIDQITSILSEYSDLDAIHLVSHGTNGTFNLGNVWLNESNLSGYAGEMASWSDALSTDADLLIYGCDLASVDSGRALTESIAALTGADVAASDDLTGSWNYGADWHLEFIVGVVETDVAISAEMQESWDALLTAITVDTNLDVVDGDTSSIANLMATKGTDGSISLREAIIAANNTGGADDIFLSAANYQLTIGNAIADNTSAAGDLDILTDISIHGA
ncbi:MAG: DUF4347 domain-containing protein, partial [Pirellulaceae bacterium]|nr:DUF4347 domain-containing protein [Pirellulaceae bacterium]